jgi:LmbE family N-acetylglucosaminyl deacetylase
VVFCAAGRRAEEAQRSAEKFLPGDRLLGPELHTFRDGFLPYSGGEVKEAFEDLKRRIAPDLILTQSKHDAHQDHRLVAELTWNTFRDHFILEYEIPKYDGDLGQPNFFVPLDSETYMRKVGYIMDSFQSQHSRAWFRPETFLGLMRLRGMECNAASGYAEAFYCRKLTF